MSTLRSRSRQGRLVTIAAVATGAGLAVAAGVVALGGATGAAVALLVAGVLSVPAVLVVGRADPVRRRADLLFAIAVGLLAVVLVAALSLVAVILVVGRVPEDEERWWFLASMAVAVGAALLYGPVRRGLSDRLRRAVVGERRDPADVVRTFGDRASRGIPDSELLLQLAESLQRTLRLARTEVWTGAGGWLERVVAVPDRPSATLELASEVRTALANSAVVGGAWLELWLPALAQATGAGGASDRRVDGELRVVAAFHSGEVLGLVVAQRRSAHDPFTAEDDVALGELGRRLGVILHNRQLDATLEATLDDLRLANEELRASRARLVAAADSERRRLERDLHDGAQQHLVAMAVNLRVARDLVADDPDAAAQMLEDLGSAVGATISELRDLAHGIYPPLLRDAGLREALRAVANRQPQDVVLETDEVGRYPADIEAAVYFCCLEALQNAAKHAPDATITITLGATRAIDGGATLRFEVADDGPGFDPDTVRMGGGLRHLGDRLGAVGGTVEWVTGPGRGTRVLGVVTVPPEAS